MADRTRDGLRACVASLRTIIAPAVAVSGDKLAREQVGLIAKYLEFAIERVDHAEGRSRFELRHYDEMGRTIAALIAGVGMEDDGLADALATAGAVTARNAATKREIEDATADLQSALSRIVRALGEARDPLARPVAKTVLEGSRAIVTLQRAWFAPQGWEVEPPGLEALLADDTKPG